MVRNIDNLTKNPFNIFDNYKNEQLGNESTGISCLIIHVRIIPDNNSSNKYCAFIVYYLRLNIIIVDLVAKLGGSRYSIKVTLPVYSHPFV